MDIISRKDEHIQIASEQIIDYEHPSWLENVHLVHNALPEKNMQNIDLSTIFLNKKILYPIIIGALTGGTNQAEKINSILAQAANKYQIPIMVGSQRITLEHKRAISSFQIIRKIAPEIPVIANLGAAQISKSVTYEQVESIIKMIQADALALHLNGLQECIQPEGNCNFEGILNSINELRNRIDVPIIIKETGAGISQEAATAIIQRNISYIDIAGVGGTSFAAIERYRAEKNNLPLQKSLGEIYRNWGIPTAASIIETKSVATPQTTIIASGGIRSGLDIARSIVIGADICAIANPFLKSALKGTNSVENQILLLERELRMAMFLTGKGNIAELKHTPHVILGDLQTWLESRKIKPILEI